DEEEYRHARDRGLSCLIYFKDGGSRETEPEKAERLAALKGELVLHHSVSTFSSPEELAKSIRGDLLRRCFDHYLTYSCADAALANHNITKRGNEVCRLENDSEHGGTVYPKQRPTTKQRPIVSAPSTILPSRHLRSAAELSLDKYLLEQGTPVIIFGPVGVR